MYWKEQVEQFIAIAHSVRGLVDVITDGTRPGLGAWDLHGLAAHTLRALLTLEAYLEQPAPADPPLADAAAYFDAYLTQRDADPATLDAAVAQRGDAAAADYPLDAIGPAFAAAAAGLAERLAGADPDRLIGSPFGAIRLADYLETRQLELVVHGLDLAHATDEDLDLPATAISQSLMLLVSLADRRGNGAALLGMLTGRTAPGPPAIPVLR